LQIIKLDKLVLWAQKWQMEFNVDKWKVMHVGNSDDSSTYHMKESELTEVSFEKGLGVWITKTFNLVACRLDTYLGRAVLKHDYITLLNNSKVA